MLGLSLAGCVSQDAQPVSLTPNSSIGLESIADASILTRERIGGQSTFVTGNSMKPIFGERTMLIFKHSWPIKRGQLIVFDYQGNRYFHQVIAIDGDRFLTKGINNDQPDPWMSRQNYVGTVYWAGWF